MIEEIIVDSNGNRTIIGSAAHRLAKSLQHPSTRCCANLFYVMEEPAEGSNWEILAAQITRDGALEYMAWNRVLVDVSNAPQSNLDFPRKNVP